MLKIFTADDLHNLADSNLEQLQAGTSENVLSPELFVVQNYGMARWLSLYIAEKEGIAANLQFKFPAEVFWQLIRVMDPDIPNKLPSERLPMTWAIFYILQENTDASLSMLQHYVSHNDDRQKEEMRRWNLARRIGDVFDQYLTYRPEMLLAWEKGELAYASVSERWQASLWRKLVSQWSNSRRTTPHHRAKLQKQLINAVDQQLIPTEKLPSCISVFGVSEMPPVYLNAFLKFSKCTDVHFYQMDVSHNANNTLAESLGQAGRNFKSLIKEMLQDDTRIEYEYLENKKSENNNTSLFHTLKNDLLSYTKTDHTVGVDHSIQVHSCHSPRREVEVLYDQLLQLMDVDETLNPSDILVLCPQMETYAPEIDAIFGAVEQGMPQIPYHLSDSKKSSEPVNLSFTKLLEIVDSRFKVTDMLDFLDFKPIRDAFSLSMDDVNTLERWIGDNRIRWGIDAEHKGSLGLPESSSYTWQAGLHRMMAGYAMAPQEDSLFNTIYPYEHIQHSDHATLLGRFSLLLHHLFSCHEQVKTRRSPAEWSRLFNDWSSIFFPEGATFFREVQWLQQMINALEEQAGQTEFNSPVSFSVIRNYATDAIEQKGTGGGRTGQGVTFSAMVQMHGIPAKIVCMIGMDDGVFPHSKNGVEFDLITKNPRKGDRVPGRDDRQLFLENIMAAKERVYFSYVGQSNKKEIEFPPSVILRELIDYLVDEYKIEESNFIQKHRLHVFSPAYFIKNKESGLFSYSERNRNVAQQLLEAKYNESAFLRNPLPEPDESFKSLSIHDLISFCQHPARYFLQHRLGIFMREDEVLDENREAFTLDSLEKYHIGQQLLQRYLQDKPLESFENVAVAQDRLPENWPGHQAFEQQSRKVKTFGARIQEAVNQTPIDTVEVDVKIGDFSIVGRLDSIFEQEQLLYRFGKMRPKDRIELWIKHLLFQLAKPANHPGKSRLITFEKDQSIKQCPLPPIPDSRSMLIELLNLYWTGMQHCIYFFPETSYAYAEAIIQKNKGRDDGIDAAQTKWNNEWSYINEGKDPYNNRLAGDINFLQKSDMVSKFIESSILFWKPFFDIQNKEKRED